MASSATQEQARQPKPAIGDRFEVIRILGQGGMGQVYQCFDRKLERVVAIKRLLPVLSSGGTSTRRFVVEAKAIASLNHRNVVHIYDIAQDQRGYYIVMEFVDGESLSAKLRRDGKLGAKDAIRMMLQVGRALELAHERGVIHRDVKPGNILITSRGVPKLADFGLAQLVRERDLTKTGTALGTWSYASPEQLEDAKRVDHRSDIYSCGATMYEMVTGEEPRHIRERSIPAELRPIIAKCLAPSPEERYQDVQGFLEALSSAYRQLSSAESTPPPVPQPPKRPPTRPETDAKTQEMILWKARRLPWSRPVRTAVGVVAILWILGSGAAIDGAVNGLVDKLSAELSTAGSSASPPADVGDLAAAYDFFRRIPYSWVLSFIALYVGVIPVLRCLRTTYRMTPTRLVIKKGLLFTGEVDYALNELEEVRVSRGLLGGLLGYGSIELRRPRKAPILLEGVPRPIRTKNSIAAQIGRAG